MTPEQRLAVVTEARSWLRTPYVNCADVKHAGVDCAMLLVRVYVDCGIIPALDPRPYAPDWFMHRSEEQYLGWVEQYATQVEIPHAGDVALFKFGRVIAHGGIICEPGVMIHASRPSGNVELCDVISMADRLVGYWSL